MKVHTKPIQKPLKSNSKQGSMQLKKLKASKINKKSNGKQNMKKINIKEMTAEDFLSGGFEDVDIDNSDIGDNSSGSSTGGKPHKVISAMGNKTSPSAEESKPKKKIKPKDQNLEKKKKPKSKSNSKKASRQIDNEENEGSSNESSNDESDDEMFTDHKKQLDNLKNTDPEFYEYLKENDGDLLNFDDSDLDSDDEEKDKSLHVAPEKLEVASDEEDYEAEDDELAQKRADNVVTLKRVEKWQEDLKDKVSSKLINDVVDAFHAAVLRISPDDEATPSVFKVEGSSVFNAIVRMCIVDLEPALRKFLNLGPKEKIIPSQIKSWRKIKTSLHNYFTDLTELSGVTSTSMLSVLLKHIHRMTPFILCFPKISQRVLKRVIYLWSSEDDVVRVLSFLCALRLVNHRKSLLGPALKSMYLTYVKNTKFVSPSTLPGINFMRQSLAELFVLDDTISYQMAFLYIRQLAIHLRNAITLKKKESYQAVYNWQFISSLQLWAEVFGMAVFNSPLRSLIYPLIQITIGTIKLIPSSQYFPLRFHCCKILIKLAEKTGIFIPVLPFLLEILKDFDFNREHKKVSMKPMELSFILRCSKAQMKENGFKDALIENIHSLLMQNLASESHRLSFPDTLVPAVIQIKQFLKTCRNANYNKKMKAVLDKVLENSKFIEGERKKHTIKLSDVQGIEAIEAQIKANGTPLLTYYDNWKKVHMQQQAIKATDNQKIGDYKLPVLYKNSKKRSREEREAVGPPELFPSDDEEDDFNFGEGESDEDVNSETEIEVKPAPKKAKVQQKKEVKKQVKKRTDHLYDEEDEVGDFNGLNDEDIVEDLNLSDLE